MQSYLIFLELYFIVCSFLTFGRNEIFQKLNVEEVSLSMQFLKNRSLLFVHLLVSRFLISDCP